MSGYWETIVAGARDDLAAMRHRPTDPVSLAAEARRLAAQGLTARDIAQALCLTVAATVALLSESPQ